MNRPTRYLFLALIMQFLVPGFVRAGAPLKINFQGRLDESGQPAEGAKTFVFKLYDAASGGNLVWTSQSQTIALSQGVFSAVLSAGTPASLSTAAFAGARYVEMAVDGVPLSPRQEMVSAPYALVAQALAPDAVINFSNIAAGSLTDASVQLTTAAISSGQFGDARVAISTGAFPGGFNGADKLVKLDGAGRLPSLDGSALVNISSTQFTAIAADTSSLRTDLNNKAADSAVVKLTGDQSIGGIKTFTANPVFNDNALASSKISGLDTTLSALAASTAPLVNSANWNAAYGWGNHAAAGYASAAALNGVIASTGAIASALTVETSARSGADSALTAQVNNVAASTGTLTASLAAVILSTGPLAGYANWNAAYGWGNHAAAGYASAAVLNGVIVSTGVIAADLAAETAARSGAVGALAAQVNNVAASTGTLTAGLAAVLLSTGPLANSASWNTAYGWGNHAAAGYAKLASANSFAGSNTFSSAAAFTLQDAAQPGVAVSSGLVVANGPVGLGLGTGVSPNSSVSVGGSFSLPVRTVTNDTGDPMSYTLTANDSTVLVAAATNDVDIYLPSAAGIAGRIYTIKSVNDFGRVGIFPVAGETMDGWDATNLFKLDFKGDFVTCQSDGTNWMIIGVYSVDLGGAGTWYLP